MKFYFEKFILFCLFCSSSTIYATVTVRNNPNTDYTWTQNTYFSEDAQDRRALLKIKLKKDSKHKKNPHLLTFIEGINDEDYQNKIKSVYKLKNSTFVVLARLAIGIMYAESKFGKHPRYMFKERFPWTVSSAKNFLDSNKLKAKSYLDATNGLIGGLALEVHALSDESLDPQELAPLLFDLSENSRGPTQIKYLPKNFEDHFPSIHKNNLFMPKNAAVATLAYLADAINELKRLASKYNCEIPKDYFLHHLLYVYVGRGSEIVYCTATLDKNAYWSRALEIQPHIESLFEENQSTKLSASAQTKLALINAEIEDRNKVVKIIKSLLNQTKKNRDDKFLIKPEDANSVIEMLIVAGFVSSSHMLLKKFQRPYADWQKQGLCKKLILGRKRYYALLHTVNAVLAEQILSSPGPLDHRLIPLDLEKNKIDELEQSLKEEIQIIKRLEFNKALVLSNAQ